MGIDDSALAQTTRSVPVRVPRRRRKRRLRLGLLVLSLPLLWLAQWQIRGQLIQPEIALVLGGAPERDRFAAQFARQHPEIAIWISSGSNPEYARSVFEQAQVPLERVRLDYQAVDTVTNFTTLVDDLQRANVHSVYLITSDYHMARAATIAQIVLGSRGIHFKSVTVPSGRDPETPETLLRGIRDGMRAILWVLTGKNGTEFVHLTEKATILKQPWLKL